MRSYDSTLETADELAAINDMLSHIGESPVSSLDEDTNADVANARRILNSVNRRVQSKGWTFNIEEVTLQPDTTTNLIPYLSDYLKVTSTSGTTTYVNRGGSFYDNSTQTDQFTNGITVSLVRLKDYSEMPECFKQLIVATAGRQFNTSFFGAQEVEIMLSRLIQETEMQCTEYELDYGQYNMLDGDAYVGGVISR